MAGRKRLDPITGDPGLFGAHLAAIAEAKGLTAAEFGERIGKDRDTITLYFSGRRWPRPADYRRVAAALGLSSIRDLLPDLPAVPPPAEARAPRRRKRSG